MKNLFLPILLLIVSVILAQAPENANDICPILVGETVPAARLVAPDGKMVDLTEAIRRQPTILVFYRGGWCPYCNRQLSGLAEIEKSVLELNYQIIAISPDDYKNLNASDDKDGYRYQIFSDPGARFIQDLGIGFLTNIKTKDYIISKNPQSKVSPVMPVPSVMVVDQKGKILFEYINPDYSQRISGELLLTVLKNLEK